MDYIQNLIVHSRGVYNFIGMILVAQVSFIFFAFMHSFQKLVSDFGHFQTPTVVKEICIKKALNANECVS